MLTFLNSMDLRWVEFLMAREHSATMDQVMIFFSKLGDKGLIWIGMAALLLFFPKYRKVGIITLAALLLSTILTEGIIKKLVMRERPYVVFDSIKLLIPTTTKYSFPSGHTSSSFAAAYVLGRYFKKGAFVFYILASLIAFSRIYLYMHFPTDIAGGIVVGIVSGYIAMGIYQWWDNGKKDLKMNNKSFNNR